MTSEIRFPQVPLVDLQTGQPSLEWFMWFQNPEVVSIVLGDALGVASGGTGLTEGTAGGVLAFTATDTIASSAALASNRIVLGGGTGVPSTPLALGTTVQVLHGNAAGAPTWGAVSLTADVTGTLPIANGGTNSALALSGSTIMVSSGTAIIQGAAGTTTTVLHGNAGGAPTYGAVVLTADVSGTLPVANGGTGITVFGTGVATALGQNVSGTGGIALTTSPTFTTPVLGAADATSLGLAGFLRPATPAGAAQTATSLYGGTGAPNNADGADGDYYFRSDGAVATHIYFKAAGVWAGII